MKKHISLVGNLLVTVVASLLMVLISVIYFMITIWVIKLGATWTGYPDLDGGTVILTAGVITAGIIISSALQK